ncbi:helix-turn-helix domain-containing protein [Mariniphaga anaerophila]|nr:helix-turn-helix domain-containing protein [Mariniphaga anaerophila]
MHFENNPQLKLAFEFINYTNQNLFLTGKAGTGKTTFLKNLRKVSPKRMIVVAPTGVAAINAGGVTIHSFFQLPFGPQIPQNAVKTDFFSSTSGTEKTGRINRFSRNKINLIRSMDLLVIDEISMVRSDVLDAIDATLRRFKNRYLPFGGVQLLMIGDLQQLAPVIKEEDWNILGKYYETGYFFSSHALKKSDFVGIELEHIYRQSEQEFIDLLNKVRNNEMDSDDLQLLNNQYQPGFSPSDEEGYIALTTHNYQAKRINDEHLKSLSTKAHRFKCRVEGDFPDYSYPADEILEIKTGAQVMFLKNDTSIEKRYYNGKIGKVIQIEENQIEVLCPDETEPIIVEADVWENTRYNLNEKTGEIVEDVVGRFFQHPLKLAWAITIHKSQGLTFEKAIIDAKQSFAHGQVYVALSRCKSLNGLVLSTPLNPESVINDKTVTSFTHRVEQNQPNDEVLEKHRKEYELLLINELFDFKPLTRTIGYLLRIWEENQTSLMGNLQTELKNLLLPVQQEMIDIAEKFRPQTKKLVSEFGFADKNHPLQERLQKASAYFLDKLQNLLETPIEQSGFETDNRAVRKRIADLLGQIETEIKVKRAGLELASNEFSVGGYLEARALASIEKPATKARKQAAALNISHPAFYNQLLEWREKKSQETGMEESQILRQKVMLEIAESLPSTAAELKKVKGMGGKKMEQFGQDILALILDFRQKKGMDIPLNAKEEVEIAGLNTKEITLALFKKGLKPNEIAQKRNFAISTVEGHLSHFVSRGELDIFELIDRDRYETIARCLQEKQENENSADVKNKLGNEYSYSEIRLVMADFYK